MKANNVLLQKKEPQNTSEKVCKKCENRAYSCTGFSRYPYIFLFATLFVFTACENPYAGFAGMSRSMREAKKNNTFVCEYSLANNQKTLKINDTIRLDIKECYMEKEWEQTKDYGMEVTDSSCYLVIIGKFSSFDDYTFGWTMATDTITPNAWLRWCSHDGLVQNIHVPFPDSINYIVHTGTFGDGTKKKVFGHFTLYKKK